MTTLRLLIRLIRQARRYYPGLHWWDLLIAGLEELIDSQRRGHAPRPRLAAHTNHRKQAHRIHHVHLPCRGHAPLAHGTPYSEAPQSSMATTGRSSRRTAGDAVAPPVTLGRSVAAVLTLTSPAVLLGCPVLVRHRCRHISRRAHHGRIPFANSGCVSKHLPVC